MTLQANDCPACIAWAQYQGDLPEDWGDCKCKPEEAPASAWIRFDDQPPEKEGCYLTYWSDGALETYYIVEDDLIEWDIRKQYIKIQNAVLTHWQPLPPPPQ